MADKTLVIVESPAKAKTINKYLGKNYIVEASVGHIKDLISFRLGVDVKNDFKPLYTAIRGKSQVIKKLKEASKSTKSVLLATDPDREGEAIAWHIAEEIKNDNENIKRVLFNEITKTGVEKGLKELRELDENLFMSQQARRVMDRLIGYQVSPFVSRAMINKTAKSLSAGRVQSVALRLICKLEKEIQNFLPIDYWTILGEFASDAKKTFKAKLVGINGRSIVNPEGSSRAENESEQKMLDEKLASMNYIRSEEEAVSLIDKIKKENYSISDIIKKQVNRKAPAPFTTSSLQQEASRRLGFPNKKTMSVAQKLYEGVTLGKEGEVGLITYMRTDSVRLSPEAQQAAREHISKTFGNDYLPESIPVFTSKSKNVQDAHEAIRPTSLEYTPAEIKKLIDKDHAALYELIYNRFLASQMKEAVYEQTSIEIAGGDYLFRITGSVVIFKGYLAVYEDDKDDKNGNGNGNGKDTAASLPKNLKKDMKLNLNDVESVKSQTKPPARYNAASLVKELDELGIGRPSTYAAIVSTLLDREYINQDKKSFVPTELGFDVNNILINNFPDLFNVKFTAEMEEELDLVAEGTKTYLEMMNDFYNPFKDSLHHANEHADIPQIICDKCGAPMEIKVSRRGRFLGCTNYPECKNTKPLPKEEKAEKSEPEIAEGIFCDVCGKQMVIRQSKFGKFYGCIDYPNCKGTKPISTNINCPKCKEGIILERFSPKSKKKFWGCSRYPDCDYLSNHEPVNQKCEKCGHDYIEVHFKKVDDNWVKYLKCPECKENYEIKA
ncbi:MAG: type I DNA topoisomerase [Ignavibacteriae bacterium]|nr:type I DNA topoisomerase [Ignavibacteriota bacterium]